MGSNPTAASRVLFIGHQLLDVSCCFIEVVVLDVAACSMAVARDSVTLALHFNSFLSNSILEEAYQN